MPVIGDVARQVLGNPAPVLLLDNCAILDLIRYTARPKNTPLPAAAKIAAAVQSTPARCWLVKASLTDKEYADNHPQARDELGRFFTDLQESMDRFRAACAVLGVACPAPFGWPAQFVDVHVALAEQLLRTAVSLDGDAAIQQRAFADRVILKRRPAHAGAIKDAVMVEEYLELARLVRQGGFAGPMVFLTSNTNDFCAADKKALHPDLTTDFAATQLDLALVWPQAVAMLGV